MRIALVINAASGSLGNGVDPAQLRQRLADAGFEVVVEPNDTAPLPRRLEEAANRPGIGAVVVAGGDGTLSCAAATLAGRELPLGILPLGTMNLLARDLGLPLDLDAALATLATGVRRRIDIGEVNGHTFVINSILGMPARLQRHREAQRGRQSLRGALRWCFGLLRHLGRYPKLSITTEVDGSVRHLRIRMLAVVNNDYGEGLGRMLVRDQLDGGRLTLYAATRMSPFRALRLAVGVVLGDWRRQPGLERIAATELSVGARSQTLRVMNDGEVLMIAPPLRYRIRPRALIVIVPPMIEARSIQDGAAAAVPA